MFSRNVGTWDSLARIIFGALSISLVFWGPRTYLGWIGLVPLATGLFNYCPVYSFLGKSTRARGGR